MIKFLILFCCFSYSFSEITQSITLNQNITLNYKIKDQTFVEFELYCTTNGWCAIGFG